MFSLNLVLNNFTLHIHSERYNEIPNFLCENREDKVDGKICQLFSNRCIRYKIAETQHLVVEQHALDDRFFFFFLTFGTFAKWSVVNHENRVEFNQEIQCYQLQPGFFISLR